MGKGKGRASAKATYAWDIKQEVRQLNKQRPHNSCSRNQEENRQRPRLRLGLGHLNNLLKERRSQENYEWLQRRRHAGYLPQQHQVQLTNEKNRILYTPLGTHTLSPTEYQSLLLEESNEPKSLQNLCLNVLGEYLVEYMHAMGVDGLHGALSLLPSESLAALSIVVSKSTGVGNSLAHVLGSHSHVEALCFRASNDDITSHEERFNDEGLLKLIPPIPDSSDSRREISWEDLDDEHDAKLQDLEYMGYTFRLKRLELVDCTLLTTNGVLLFLEKCPFLKHLSLAGSLNRDDTASTVIECLPRLLPGLQVLDITRCSWVTPLLVKELQMQYRSLDQTPPTVHFQRHMFNKVELNW